MIKSLLKDTIVYGFADFIFKFVAFFTFPVFTRIFSVDEYGVLSLVTTIVGVSSMISVCGVNNAVSRKYYDPNIDESERPSIVSSGLFFQICWSFLINAIVFFIAFIANKLDILSKFGIPLDLLALGIFTIIPTLIITFINDVTRLHFKPWRFFWISSVKNLLGVLLNLVLVVFLGFHLNGFFLGTLIALSVAAPFGLFLIKKDLTFKISLQWIKKIFAYGYPFIYMGLAYWVFQSADKWMLSLFKDNTQTGYYSVAARFATIIFFLNSAFGKAWSPIVVKTMKDYPDTYREKYKTLSKLWLAFLCTVGIALALLGKELLELLTPEEYWPAYFSVIFLCFSAVFMGSTQITAIGISLSKKTKIFALSSWIAAMINILLNLALIPVLGSVGASISTCITYLILTGIYLHFSKKYFQISIDKILIVKLLLMIGISIVLCFVLQSISLNTVAAILIKLIIIFLIVSAFVHQNVIEKKWLSKGKSLVIEKIRQLKR